MKLLLTSFINSQFIKIQKLLTEKKNYSLVYCNKEKINEINKILKKENPNVVMGFENKKFDLKNLYSNVKNSNIPIIHFTYDYLEYDLNFYELNTDIIITSNNTTKELLKNSLKSKEIHTIHEFIDVKNITPIFENEGFYLYFSNLNNKQILECVLQAQKINNQNMLVIVGDGIYSDEVERIIEQHYLNIVFIKKYNIHTTKELINRAKFLIMPELNINILLEANAKGKPVISCRNTLSKEYIKDNITGLFCDYYGIHDLAEKIDYVMNEHDVALDLGMGARIFCEINFNKEFYFEKLNNILNNNLGLFK